MVDDGLGAEALDEISDFDGVHGAAPSANEAVGSGQ
jgi:hypothetical protein